VERLLTHIRDYEQVEHALRQRRNRLRESQERADERVAMILDSVPDNFFAFSKHWRYTYFNRHAAEQLRILGKDPANLIGRSMWEEFPYVPNETALRRAMTERVVTTDELYYPPLGEWIENHMYPSDDGGLVIFQRYITERKRAEQELRRSEANLAEGQRISHTGSWAWNAHSDALFWSVEHFRIFGLDPDKAASRELGFGMIHPEDRTFVEDIFQGAVREKSDFEVEYRIVRPDGTVRHLCSVGHPVLSESGDLGEYVGTVIDRTDRKHAEEALRITEAELARVSRVLTMGELTASIAHEVNQSLGAVITNSNACMRWLAAPSPNLYQARKALDRIVRDGNRASDVIARIRALIVKTGIKKERLDMNLVIHDVVVLTRAAVSRNRVTLRTALDSGLPRVLGDRVQLQQVLLNLIMNAIEAMVDLGDRSPVLVITTQTDDVDHVHVSVQDSGTGLEPESLDRVFEAFYTTKVHGMGIGLSISRSIIEAHGGHLWVTQNEGPGATFHFSLPPYHADAA
jgi:PAS domain S-box-containing protein